MILTRADGVLEAVTQSDHAHLAAELLSLWRGDGLPQNPRRPAILEATREHDNGWRESDSAPQVAPDTGEPYDFRTLPDDRRLELWHRGVERATVGEPYAAALIAHHAIELHRERTEPEWLAALTRWGELRDELSEAAGVEPATRDRDYELLRAADQLSLGLALRRVGEQPIGELRARFADEELFLDPFPLAGATTFSLRHRRIDRRSYENSIEFAVILSSSQWESRPIRVRPG